MEKKVRVAAVVVTYNRAQMLLECLDALLCQDLPLGKIYIVDNASTDDTVQRLTESGYLINSIIYYVRLTKNTGGAGGFTHGLKLACQDGWDWVWLMDDDAQPALDCLGKLADGLQQLTANADEAFCICPRVMNYFSRDQEWHQHKRLTPYFMDVPVFDLPQRFIRIDGNAFVGPLVSRGSITKIGLPNTEYFLWVDDLDFTYRVARHGRLVLDRDSTIWHKDHNPGQPGPDKCYYWVRNYLWFLLHTVRKNEGLKGIAWLRWSVAIVIVMRRSLRMTRSFLPNRNLKLSTRLLPLRALLHSVMYITGKSPQ